MGNVSAASDTAYDPALAGVARQQKLNTATSSSRGGRSSVHRHDIVHVRHINRLDDESPGTRGCCGRSESERGGRSDRGARSPPQLSGRASAALCYEPGALLGGEVASTEVGSPERFHAQA